MSAEPLIRPAAPSDAGNLAALTLQVWLHTYATEGISSTISQYVLSEFTAAKFEKILSRDDSVILVAEINGNLIGYALITFGAECPSPSTSSRVELATLYVQEHFARMGIGSALLVRSQMVAEERTGHAGIWLTVNAQNERAIAFYRKHRFAHIGVDYFELGGVRHENLVLVGGEG